MVREVKFTADERSKHNGLGLIPNYKRCLDKWPI